MQRLTRPSRSLLAALCTGYFLVLLDVTVVNVALPQIRTHLASTATTLAWVVDAYTVPLAALLLAAGAVGDRVGHRPVVLSGFVVFGVSSMACAIAPSIGVLIASRAVQGVGAALMLPGTLAMLVSQSVDGPGRTRIVGIWAAIGGCALPAGPLVGGLLAQVVDWRAVFWLSVPLIAAACLPVWRSPRTTPRGDDAPVDWGGAATLALALACFVAGIIQFSDSPLLAGGLMAGAAITALTFVAHERTTHHPLLVLTHARLARLAMACAVAGAMNLCMLGGLFVLTQLLQAGHNLAPFWAGVATLPAMVPLPLLAPVSSRLSARIGVWRTSAVGLLMAAIGFLAMAASVHVQSLAMLLGSLTVWGAGTAVLTPAIVAAAVQAAPDTPGSASGASNTARQAGGAIGVALFAAVATTPGTAHFTTMVSSLFLAAAVVFLTCGLVCLASHSTAARP